ncbi:Cell cycle checkpoint protein RAD17 [Habropoda laboriosa]|uniref:Cell cycle checkpoint protein RAD17 n=2 Tax=Habropoda laboriosa TaxID=597456 RepID=A0A0L7QLD9_9HYME|nr:Cell cycle checkpoint protein RAD17 [Habropoda laboriosa]
MPSFDHEPVKKRPGLTCTTSQTVETNVSQAPNICDIIPKRRNNLSALLKACEPQKSSEVVVSRQKQQEILDWLQYKVRRGRPSVLILSGPSGCGKTTAIKVLAKENNFNVIEWITPIDQAMDENNRIIRQKDQFEEFLIRATRYKSVLSNYQNRLLLVKDFPNFFFGDKESFFSLLEKYFEFGKEPIVFICTEVGNSKVLQTLFPPNIKEKFGIDLINVNSVTQTAMKNALKRIADTLNLIAGDILNTSQHKVDEILSNNVGDVRNAVLNLIFISLKVPNEQENKCNIREETLGLLHAVGRVINPKRIQTENCWKFVHDPDEIAAFFQSQATVFLRFLQENYLNTMRGIEEVNTCADILSSADVLNSEWRDPNLTTITLSFCVRGMMVKNEKPVSGWNPVRKPPNDRVDMQRCLAAAEVRWYDSIINTKSKSTMELPDVDIETAIE